MDRLNSRIQGTEDSISELEDRTTEIIHSQQRENGVKKRERKEESQGPVGL